MHAVQIDRVIIWGHKLHSHTHSYVHHAFFKAFKHMDYETHWLDNNDDISDFDFSHSLFLTEGQVDSGMPRRDDCVYVLHNCDDDSYADLYQSGNVLKLQVYTHACLENNVEKLAPYTYIDRSTPCLYMPWATDLLPHEIDAIKRQLPTIKTEKTFYFIGTFMSGEFDNTLQYIPFIQAARQRGIGFKHLQGVSPESAQTLIQKSCVAPALQGRWQCENGYIPCRIFKHISYGKIGGTNNPTVYDLFEQKIVFTANTYQLFFDLHDREQHCSLSERSAMMDFVRDHHTYLNRIKVMLHALQSLN